MKFEKPIEGREMGCGAFPQTAPEILPLNRNMHPGFGEILFLCNDELLMQINYSHFFDTMQYFENMSKNYKGDLRIIINAPLYELEYQRQGEGKWVLIKQGQGFA